MDKDNTLPATKDEVRIKKGCWLVRNPGIIRGLAGELKLSPGFVCNIFHHKRSSADRKVEARFVELGAPGFLTVEAALQARGIKRVRGSKRLSVHHSQSA